MARTRVSRAREVQQVLKVIFFSTYDEVMIMKGLSKALFGIGSAFLLVFFVNEQEAVVSQSGTVATITGKDLHEPPKVSGGQATGVFNYSKICQRGFDLPDTVANESIPAETGHIFVKTFKTGSSTASGIALRISRNLASRLDRPYKFCESSFNHGKASDKFKSRDRELSFMWTIVREPTARAVSHFFFREVSRRGRPQDDISFKKYCLTESKDAYLEQLSLEGYNSANTDRNITARDTVQSILKGYDFIAITERFDESLLALQILLNLRTEDLLYLKAKSNGGYDGGGGENGNCTYIKPSYVSAHMANWFDSDEWNDAKRYDQLLYDSANESLDKLIEGFGKELFQRRVERFRRVQQHATRECLPKAIFPCSSRGQKVDQTNCLWKDSGCGADCLDKIASNLDDDGQE